MFETDTADNSLAEVVQHLPCHSLFDVKVQIMKFIVAEE